jgi:hypothetical protein
VSFEHRIAAIALDQGVGAEESALLEQPVVGAEPVGEGLGANEVYRSCRRTAWQQRSGRRSQTSFRRASFASCRRSTPMPQAR